MRPFHTTFMADLPAFPAKYYIIAEDTCDGNDYLRIVMIPVLEVLALLGLVSYLVFHH